MTAISKEVALLNTSANGEIIHVGKSTSKNVGKGDGFTNISRIGLPKYQTHRDDSRPVSFLAESEIYAMCDAVKNTRNGSRDALFIEVTFKCCLRVSEAIALTPSCRGRVDSNFVLLVKHGKGDKPRILGINQALYDRLGSYALDNQLGPEEHAHSAVGSG